MKNMLMIPHCGSTSCNRSGDDSNMQAAADQTVQWTSKNNMQLNTDNTKGMRIYFGHKALQIVPIKMDGHEIECVSFFKLLGIRINAISTWNNHIDYICGKASCRIYFLILLRWPGKSPLDLVSVFCSLIRSILEYSCEVWPPGFTREHLQVRDINLAYPQLEYSNALSDHEGSMYRRSLGSEKIN